MRLNSLVVAVVTASGLFLANPGESRADHPRVGIRVGDFRLSVGGGHHDNYSPGYAYYPQTYVPAYGTYSTYDSGYIVTPRPYVYSGSYGSYGHRGHGHSSDRHYGHGHRDHHRGHDHHDHHRGHGHRGHR